MSRRSAVFVVALGAAALVVVGLAAGLLAGPLARPASAHTDLLQASPGPGQRAGGDIRFLDLVFTEPVSDAQVTVTLDGEVVAGETTATDGIIIRFELDEPLATPGRYEVAYDMISFDLDETADGYFFFYEPSAPEPLRLGVVEDPGPNWTVIGASVVLGACVVGLLFLFVTRLESQRRASADTD